MPAMLFAAVLAGGIHPAAAQEKQFERPTLVQPMPAPDASKPPALSPDQIPPGALVPPGTPPALTFIGTGDVVGYLEPCG